ncbi:MAG: hypothetical protein ACAH59_03870 [Pseudobdellovibrionaceae bacterium]
MKSQANLIRNALITIYILIVLGISATARANVTIDPIFTDFKPAPTKTYVGEVAMTPNQEFYLVVSEAQVYRLEANVDLFDYNGQKVAVEASELKHLTGPEGESFSLDPLPGSDSHSVAVPVLVVFGISGLATQ